MTFSEQVKSRRKVSIIAFFAGLLATEVLVWVLMTFVVFVALSADKTFLSVEMRRMILIINQVVVLAAAICMWIARGIQLSADITSTIQNASSMQKHFLGMQLTEEAEAESSIAKVTRLIEKEGVEVVDITGGATPYE